jgi:DNA-binding GntR family transcriptional regulator
MTDSVRFADRFAGVARVPAPRVKLADEVVTYLREGIMIGRYRSNERLGVEELARELDVSTMPIREALLTLASEGLVEVQPRRGARVVELDVQDIEDVYEAHAHFAGRLAERASSKFTDDALTALADMQQQIEAAAAEKDSEAVEALNFQFHRVINRTADAPRLQWFIRAATRYVPRRFYEEIPGWSHASAEDHPSIVEALQRRDGQVARILMERHVMRAGLLVVQFLKESGWPDTTSASPE